MSQATKKSAVEPSAAVTTHIAPPFAGAGFGIYKSGPAAPNFWSALRQDVSKGGLVVQLGADPNAPVNSNFHDLAFAGFQYQFTTDSTHLYYMFRANFDLGAVTVKNPSENIVTPYCGLLAPGISGSYPVLQQVVSNTPVTLQAGYSLLPNKTYKIQVIAAVDIFRLSLPKVPYGEVIVRGIDLTLTKYGPPNAQAVTNLSDRESVVEPVASMQEAGAKGLIGTF